MDLLCLKFAGAENKRGFRMIFGFVGRSITFQTWLHPMAPGHGEHDPLGTSSAHYVGCWAKGSYQEQGKTPECSRIKQWIWAGKWWVLSCETVWKVNVNRRSYSRRKWVLFRSVRGCLWNSVVWIVVSEGIWNVTILFIWYQAMMKEPECVMQDLPCHHRNSRC